MLRVTKLADYGVVLMTHFAAHPDATHNAKDMAKRVRLPLPVVSKILKMLARDGLLVSHRGTKGGYSLARQPQSISVGSIIRAMEGPVAVTQCSDSENGECGLERGCPVRTNWKIINQAIQDTLERITLAEMAQPNSQSLVNLHASKEMERPFIT